MTNPDVTPEDAIAVAQRALERAEEADQADEIAELKDRVAALELKHENDEREYHTLSLDEKVARVRSHAYERATDKHGKATLEYDDVMYSVFDGEPGAKHCYKLMRRAAGVENGETGSTVPGFTFRDKDQLQLTVNAEQTKRGLGLFPENKAERAEAD